MDSELFIFIFETIKKSNNGTRISVGISMCCLHYFLTFFFLDFKVDLANTISRRIREKQGEITDDETIRFKSYLMSLGIDDPVTRETHGSGQDYFRQLAKEIHRILEQPIRVRNKNTFTYRNSYQFVMHLACLLMFTDYLCNIPKYMFLKESK